MPLPVPTPDPNSAAWNIYVDNQSFNLTGLDGTPTTLSLPYVNEWIYAQKTSGAIQGFVLGFGSMLLIVLLALTKGERRRQPIYLLNLASLVLIVFRSIVNLIINDGSYSGLGQMLLGASNQYGPGTFTPSILSNLANPPLYSTITASLVLQVRVVFAAEPMTRRIVTLILSVAAIVLVAFETTFTVYSIMNQFTYVPNEPLWLYTVIRIYFVIFVGLTSLIFLYKLSRAIRRRKRMNQPSNPLHIFFIFSCQCLIVPSTSLSTKSNVAILYILDLCNIPTPSTRTILLGNLAQIMLISSLPLSTLWASSEAHKLPQTPMNMNASVESTATESRSWRSKWSWWIHRHEVATQDSMHSSHISDDVEKAPSYVASEARRVSNDEHLV
jgi:hypothetical protein